MIEIKNECIEYCHKECDNIDKEWIKRKRKIGTCDIFNTLLTSATTNSGVSTNVHMTNNYSHVGFIKARNKLPENTFNGRKKWFFVVFFFFVCVMVYT